MRNRKLDINEPDEIKSVIDFLTAEKDILSITENSGTLTIDVSTLKLLNDVNPIYLKEGQIVTINNVNYPVLSVDYINQSFTITSVYIVATKWNLAINFHFGSRIEINQLLNLESLDPDLKLQRFPLFWLFINESREHDNPDYDFKTGLKIAFVGMSTKELRAQNRLDEVIKPVLQPLVTLFLAAIQSAYFSTKFNWEYQKLTYNEYYRYFYGSSDKNEMVLTAPTDAIEIDLDVTFQNQY